MYLIFDIKSVENIIKNTSTTNKETLNIISNQVLIAYEKLKPLHLELVNKNISFKDNFPDLFEDYKILFELSNIIEDNNYAK